MFQDEKSQHLQMALSETTDLSVYIAKELRRMADGGHVSHVWAVSLWRAAADLLEKKDLSNLH